MSVRLFLATLLIPFSQLAFAQAPAAKLEQLAWMQGYWVGEGLGGTVEDFWGPPRAGAMLGTFRLTRADGKAGFYQLFAIEEWEGSLRFVFRHFQPDLAAWEEKDKPIRLPLTRIGAEEAAFGGVAFRRAAPDVLEVDLTMRSKDGAARTEKLVFRKKAL